MASMAGDSIGGTRAPLVDCSGKKLVGRLRFKPEKAVVAQNAKRDLEKAIAEGTGWGLAEGEMQEIPETFHDKLNKAIALLDECVSIQAPAWLGDPHDLLSDHWDPENENSSRPVEIDDITERESNRCFDAFVEDAERIVFSYLQDRAIEKEEEFHKQLTKTTRSHLESVIAYRDRLAPRVRSIEIPRFDEDELLYKSLQKWSEEQQHVMKEMIDERLRQLLIAHQGREYEAVEEEVVEEAPVQDLHAFEEDEEAAQARRARELAEAMEKKAKLQAENDELQRLLGDMRGKLDACSAEMNQLNGEMDRMAALLAVPDEPIPVPDVKVVAPPEVALPPPPPRKAPRKAPPPVAAPIEEKVVEDNVDWAALEAAEKEAFEKELARLTKEALDNNAKEWKGERDGLLKRIGALEGELKRLEVRRAEREASRISTEVPAELSQETVEEQVSIESVPQETTEVVAPVEEAGAPAAASAAGAAAAPGPAPPQSEVRKSRVSIPRASFTVAMLERKGPVFDNLYVEAELKRVRVEDAQKSQHEARMVDFQSTEQKRSSVGGFPLGPGGPEGVPMEGLLSGSRPDSGTVSRCDSGIAGSRPTSGQHQRPSSGNAGSTGRASTIVSPGRLGTTSMRDQRSAQRLQESAGSPGNLGTTSMRASVSQSASSFLKRASFGVQSEGQLRVRLRGPLPALVDWLSLEPLQPRADTGSRKSGSHASRKSQRATDTAPYDILRPTLRQVDAHCKIPTALSRMAGEAQEEPSPEPCPEFGTGAAVPTGMPTAGIF